MLSFEDVKTFLLAGLETKGYTTRLPLTDGWQTMPLIDPGPFAIASVQKTTPGALVFATVGNGAGLTLEHTYDQTFITVRVLGRQLDYNGAEGLAYDVDRLLLAVDSVSLIGDTRVLYVTRTGGPPELVDLDASDRYHFQCTYITPAATGL